MKVAHMKSFSGAGHVLSADSAPSAVRLVGVAVAGAWNAAFSAAPINWVSTRTSFYRLSP